MTLTELPPNVASLSTDEKLLLIDALWNSIAAEGLPPLSDEQRAELDRRMAAYEADPSSGRSWEQVRARCEQWKADRGA